MTASLATRIMGALHEFILQVLIFECKVRLDALPPALRPIFMHGVEVEVYIGAYFVRISGKLGLIMALEPGVVFLVESP